MRGEGLRLYAAHGAGPLWTRRGPVAIEDIAVSERLADALADWQRNYETDELCLSEVEFFAVGGDLAQRVADETGRQVQYEAVVFDPKSRPAARGQIVEGESFGAPVPGRWPGGAPVDRRRPARAERPKLIGRLRRRLRRKPAEGGSDGKTGLDVG